MTLWKKRVCRCESCPENRISCRLFPDQSHSFDIGFDVATDNCRRLPVATFLHLDENPAGQFDFEGGAEFPIQRTHRDDGATAAPTGIQIGADTVM